MHTTLAQKIRLTALSFILTLSLLCAPVSNRACRAQGSGDASASPAPLVAASPAPDDELAGADLGEAEGPVRELRAIKDKTVIFVFDVSGSMRGENLRRAREATVGVLRYGIGPGDRAVLFTFGAGYQKVFDRKIAVEADKRELINLVPSAPGEGAGTNIRRPHHEALKILEAEHQARPDAVGAVILLTDSFNDEPKQTDAAYADYLRYYTPGGRLAKFPDTPENRDYTRLLAQLYRTQKVKMFGIGVQIDQNGRPVERLPQAAPTPSPVATETTTQAPPPVRETGVSPFVWFALGLAALATILYFVAAPLLKPVPLRIAGGPGGPKDYQLKGGQSVKIGGDGAGFAFDSYAVPGTKTPVALVRSGRGGFSVAPYGPPVAATATAGPKAYHNGAPLERDTPLNYGDEVRVTVPDPATGINKDYRLKFEDPKKTF